MRYKKRKEEPAFGGLTMKDVDLSVLVENNLWDNTNVEFPEYCRPSWSKAEEA